MDILRNRLGFLTGIAFLAVAILTVRCSVSSGAAGPVSLDVTQPPYEKLSDYNFFTGRLSELEPNERVLPYDLITPLFTDYAEKARFVWMPEGTASVYHPEEVLELPVGSVLIKNFYYFDDVRDPGAGKRIMETRLLVHRENKWDALTYIWDADQKDAQLEVAGDFQEVQFTDAKGLVHDINYVIPNKNQCKGCHEYKGKLMPIGPKVRNLNHDFEYPDGKSNQLEKWASVGYLGGYDAAGQHGRNADWDDPSSGSLQDRALAYMEVNCGHCHRPEGPASVSGLNLMTTEHNLFNLGFCKSPVSAGKGSGGHTYDIVPGHPEKSILVYRMTTDDPGARMPELGRSVMHAEGVELISEWIASLEGGCPEGMDAN